MNLAKALAVMAFVSLTNALPSQPTVSFTYPALIEKGGMHNVHVEYHLPHDGELSIVYGMCDILSSEDAHHALGTTHVGNHHLARRHLNWEDHRPTRFVWLAPEDMIDGGCLHAFSGDELLGRSAPISSARRNQRRWLAASDVMDSSGPWFDGVAYLQEKEPDEVFVAQTKSKTIGILGGGMSGLMTAHLLDSVGFYDWQIIESTSRIGGRVHTAYLNGTTPDEYQYQEMGPMRFPTEIALDNETLVINDHKMVFQLADVLNQQNGNGSDYQVGFIQFIQQSANEPSDTTKRRPDGTVPGITEVSNTPAYQVNANATYANATAVAEAEQDFDDFIDMDRAKMRLYTSNVFQAHKQAIKDGYLDFSESGYLRYKLGLDINVTDSVDTVADAEPAWPYDDLYFEATKWRTIDKGLTQLPRAFGPQVLNRTRFQTTVEGLAWNKTTQKMAVKFHTGSDYAIAAETLEFDYTVIAVPFSRVRLWRLPEYSSLLSRAIQRLAYSPACKVALQYKTRFWEHLEHPIIGGCGSGGSIPGISSVCYPSYKINSTGPGVILGSYISGTMAKSLDALTEEEHVAMVQRAMIEIHGDIAREQYTGNYDRKCWDIDENQAGAWAAPTPLQQRLYLPAYFQTEMHSVFVGEHTSYTHAWIFSALESAVRGTTQLLLDMGLVDEAKQITEFWMARWISM